MNSHDRLLDSEKLTLPGQKEQLKNPILAFLEFIGWLILIILFANIIHRFVFHPFYVIGESMETTFQNGNYVFVEKVSYQFNDPERGDVIVFTPPWEEGNIKNQKIREELGVIRYEIARWSAKIQNFFHINAESLDMKSFIKRVIGLPGETVIINEKGEVTIENEEYPEGLTLKETYIRGKTGGTLEYTLEEGEYFVMGDNRGNSLDSRGTTMGKAANPHPVPAESIQGKVFIRLLPVNRFGFIELPDYAS
jgi:signal peptidase I